MLIACPNLTIDRTLSIEEMRLGEVLRFRSAAITPGGKGVNVARVARALGASAVLVGFTPGHTGRAVASMIAQEGIELSAVPTGGEVRSTAVILEDSGRVTVFNEPGPMITPDDWEAYEKAVESRLAGQQVLICTGSTPPGSPPDAYARLVEIGRRAGVTTVVDANAALLRRALAARPAVVAPNLSEAEAALGKPAPDGVFLPPDEARARALEAGARLVELGAETAVITAGAAGLALVGSAEPGWVPAPPVEARNPVGAGDSFVGGFAAALEAGNDLEQATLRGTATAAASVETALAGGIDTRRVEELVEWLERERHSPTAS